MFSDFVKHFNKNIHIHSLNLLNFAYIVVFDAKLAIQEWIELQIFFVPSLGKFFGNLQKSKCLFFKKIKFCGMFNFWVFSLEYSPLFLISLHFLNYYLCNRKSLRNHAVYFSYVRNNYFNLFQANAPLMEKPGWMVFISKICDKHLWKSDILSKDASHGPASLLKMSLFHRCFSHILLVKTNYLVSP